MFFIIIFWVTFFNDNEIGVNLDISSSKLNFRNSTLYKSLYINMNEHPPFALHPLGVVWLDLQKHAMYNLNKSEILSKCLQSFTVHTRNIRNILIFMTYLTTYSNNQETIWYKRFLRDHQSHIPVNITRQKYRFVNNVRSRHSFLRQYLNKNNALKKIILILNLTTFEDVNIKSEQAVIVGRCRPKWKLINFK